MIEHLEKITVFLENIGIPVVYTELPEDTFLPGIQIQHGSLAVDTERLCYVGDLLHEAGHIACMAPSTRLETFADAGEDMGEEIASHAWSYAAALACGLPPEEVFHENGYKGSASWLCAHYKEGGTNGVPLLQWFNMTHMPDLKNPDIMNPNDFPCMQQWLRPMDDPTKFWQEQPD
ncbi:hypothetical protein KFE96_13505 [Kordiimonas sp. SCSIO 12603]|uniref:hypothetical protein n=1 Tax=Kordiimonas sp. SCSIO 12603 TaxID=2829596 RepID=UPI0021084C21|nr:hypothetical protein [Kordiimonas sp. SCSIO 12603]UTW57840.1 hypothetical protein KFE96_13505 [Kordiimonas sp. SCSIO 12603]